MKIIYYSMTGNCIKFLKMCKIDKEDMIDIWEIGTKVDFDYILLTPTVASGKIPEDVVAFLEKNNKHLKGVVGSGNKKWGNQRFAKAADKISEMYNVPVIMKIQLYGTTKEIIKFRKYYLEMKNKK